MDTNLRRAFENLVDAQGSVRAICLLRVLVGGVVLSHLHPFLRDMVDGVYFADFFYSPWFEGFPVPSKTLYFVLLSTCVVTALAMVVGFQARASTLLTFGFVAYNFFLSELHFRHNRNFLLVILAGLCLFPVGRAFSLDAWLERRRSGTLPSTQAPLWPLWLLRLMVATPYFASGWSKFIDPDWWGGTVTWDRVLRFRHLLDRSPAPAWVGDLVTQEGFHTVFAKVAILTELFLAVGLWFRPTRYAAIWVALVFHLSIEVSARVQVFSLLAIAATLIWVVPRERDRVIYLRKDRFTGRFVYGAVSRFDWLARFRIDDTPADQSAAVVLQDRDGRCYAGPRAARIVLSRLPVFAFFVLPTLFPGVATAVDRACAGLHRAPLRQYA